MANCVCQMTRLAASLARVTPVRQSVVVAFQPAVRQLWGKTAPNEDEQKKQEDFNKTSDQFDRTTAGRINPKELIVAKDLFNRKDKNKETFLAIVEAFSTRTISNTRVGQCEFIFGALKSLKEFNLHRDLEVYKKLLEVMPKEKMVAQNAFQEMGIYYPKHQDTAMDLMDFMDSNRVMPDREFEKIVLERFGERSNVWRKLATINYWNGKFKFASPFPLPDKLPQNSLEFAKLVMKRICPDLQTKIQVYDTSAIKNSLDKTWIVTAQSPLQKDLIANLNETLYVEGPFQVVLRDQWISYFMLRTAPPKEVPIAESELEDEDPYDVSNLSRSMYGKATAKQAVMESYKLHMQNDGTIVALAITGTSSRDSLLSWVRILEHFDANLKKLSIIFKLKAPERPELTKISSNSSSSNSSSSNNNDV